MKKTLLLAASLFTCIALCAQQPTKSDLENENIRGKVKSLSYQSIPADSSVEVVSVEAYDPDEFDILVTDSANDYAYSTSVKSYTETFNASGYMLEGRYQMDNNYVRTKTYDKDNNLIKDYYEDNDDDSVHYFDYTFENGKTVREECYYEGSLYYVSLYEYTEGNLTRETIIDGDDGSALVYYNYAWFDGGKEKNATTLDADDDSMRSFRIEKYDDKGNMTEYSETDIYGETSVGFFRYDKDGNKIWAYEVDSSSYYSPTLRVYNYEYDKYGNVIHEYGYIDGRPDVTYYEYEYDSIGNWISRKAYDGEEKTHFRTATRTFEYYK